MNPRESALSQFAYWMLAPCLVCSLSSAGRAQEPTAHSLRVQQSTTAAGIRHYSRGEWGLVGVTLRNPTDEDVEVLSVIHVEGEPHLQFARKLWVPAQSVRQTWQPFRPSELSPDARPREFDANGQEIAPQPEHSIPYQAFLVASGGADREMVTGRTGRQDGLLSSSIRRSVTAMIDADRDDSPAYHAVIAMRVQSSLSRRVSQLSDLILPPSAQALQGADQLVVANDRLIDDAAGLDAVRHWVFQGGRLWLMLDQVDPTLAEQLLGDAFHCEVVDRVELTDVRIDRVDAGQNKETPREFETPVGFLRVLAPGATVLHTVNGWPASFWIPVGRGRVLITTLDPRAWILDQSGSRQPVVEPNRGRRGRQDPVNNDANFTSTFQATPQLDQLADILLSRNDQELINPDVLKVFLTDQVGADIAGRPLVITILGGFCASFVALGLWFIRRSRLDRLGWIGPLAASVASVVFFVMGEQAQRSVPPTVARSQVISVANDTNELHINGLVGIYNQEKTEPQLGVDGGGELYPEIVASAGTTRRMVTTDEGQYHWENLSLPPGMQYSRVQQVQPLEQPIRAIVQFGPDGIQGRVVRGQLGPIEDAVLATASADAIAVRLRADDRFDAAGNAILGVGEFIVSPLLSDEQLRRQRVYRGLLAATGVRRFLARPTLLAWTGTVETRLKLPTDFRESGSALVAIPLEFERTPPDTRVWVASPFLPLRAIPAPGEDVLSGAFNNNNGAWAEQSVSSLTWLRFQLPVEVQPLDIEQATVTINVAGLTGELSIEALVDGKRAILKTWRNPVGTLQMSIDRTTALSVDDQGGVQLGVRVQVEEKEQEIQDARDFWKVNVLRLDVVGRTRPTSN